MPTLNQKIGSHDYPPIGGAQHGGVVARTEQYRGTLRQSPGNSLNDPEFAEISDCDVTPPVLQGTVTDLSRLEDAMVQAYILIQTEVGKAATVAREISAITGVTQAEDVTGPYDVIVRAEAHNVDELGKLVVAQIQAVEGITRTLTCPIVHI
jgi:DNA-binding Lrp family transcriptional regulator